MTQGQQAGQRTDWIDVHHHILPARYAQALHRMGVSTSGGANLPEWNADASLAVMDRNGVRSAMMSVSSPGVYAEHEATAHELTTICNEELLTLVAKWPDRFGAFAALPLPHVGAAMRVLERLPQEFDGVGLIASYGNRYLGHSDFTPVFEELNRRKAVVFVHPTIGPGSLSFDIDVLPAAVEFTFDTTRAVLSLLRSGVFHRCPDIKFIFAHNGGTIPFLAGRIASLIERRLPYQEFAPRGVAYYLARQYYECTTSTSDATLACMVAFVPSSQILFGTDYPFAPEPVGVRGMKELSAFSGLAPGDLARIASANALQLFSRLGSR